MDEQTTEQMTPYAELIKRLDKIIALLAPPLTEADVRRMVREELQQGLPTETIDHVIEQFQNRVRPRRS